MLIARISYSSELVAREEYLCSLLANKLASTDTHSLTLLLSFSVHSSSVLFACSAAWWLVQALGCEAGFLSSAENTPIYPSLSYVG